MRIGMLTREYPPEVYGGGGVHVEFLVRELRKLVDVEVLCFGAPRSEPRVFAYGRPAELGRLAALTHVVRQPRRSAGLDAFRRPARAHRPLAGTTTPLESRATRRWLPHLVLGGAPGIRDRRGRHSSQLRNAR